MPVIESCTTHYEATGNFSLTKPASLANGDRLIVAVSWEDATDPAITLPSGFFQMSGSPIVDTTGNDMGLYVVYKDITDAGSEPASYSFTFAPFHWAAAVRVSSPGSMVLYGNSRSLEANSDTEILTGYSSLADNSAAVGFFVDYAHGGLTPAPTGWSNVTDNAGKFVYIKSDVDTGTYSEASSGRFGTVMWVNAVVVIQPAGAATAPGQVTGVAATSVQPGALRVGYTAPSDGGSAITSYDVDWALASAPTSWLGPVNTGSTAVSYDKTGLTNDTAYVFRVRAVNAIGNGAWSATSSSATPTIHPHVASWATEGGTSLGSANAQPLPTGAATGDLVFYVVGNDNTSTTNLSASTGWEASSQITQGSNVIKGRVFARKLTGTTGDNILSVTGAAQDYSIVGGRIPAAEHNVTDVASWATNMVAGFASTSNGNANPPNLAPAAGSDEYLWITAAIIDATTGNTISADPTDFSAGANVTSASSTSSCVTRVATRRHTAASLDPGTFTNTSRPFIAFTMAVPPAVVLTVPGAPTSLTVTSEGDSQVGLSVTAPADNGGTAITDYVWEYRIADPSPTFSETFTGSDGTTIGSPWTTAQGNGFQINGNRARPINDADDTKMRRGSLASADGYVQATVNSQNSYTFIQARDTGTLRNEIDAGITPDRRYRLNEFISSTEFTLDETATNVAPDLTDVLLRLEVEGTAARLYADGVLVCSGTITTQLAGTIVSIAAYRQAGGTSTFDNFEAGPLFTADTWHTFSDGTSTSTSTTVTGLTGGTVYEFRVAAVNSVGQGAWSNTVTGTPTTGPVVLTGTWGIAIL
jgi:hypothetical protein